MGFPDHGEDPTAAKNVDLATEKTMEKSQDHNDEFSHLSLDEAEILRRQLSDSSAPVRIGALYRFATLWDKFIIFISLLCAIPAGTARPLMSVRKSKHPAKNEDSEVH